jgi:MFS family permease
VSVAPASPRYAWYVVGVLMLLYVNSFLDRVIISLVIEPMKHDLGITDTQISLLQGLAFALFYSVLAVPFGRLADRRSRRWIIGIGATFWAVMASLCGLAHTYWQLFLARMGLGVGEASLMPAAYSMVSDYFPRERLPRAYAVLMLGAPIGTAVAFGAGGAIVSYATSVGSVTLPLLGEIRSWQLVFLITGLPGIPLGLWALATLREPARRGRLATPGAELPWGAAIGYLRSNWSTYGALLTGLSITAMFGSGYMSWVAVYFMRVHELTPGQFGALFGLGALVAGIAGILGGSAWCDWLRRRGATDAPLRTAIHALLVAVPLGIAAPLVDDWRLSFALVTLLVFFLTFPQGSNVAAFTLVTPNELRGQVSAVFLLAINVCGLGFGATLVALITDYGFADSQRVGDSLAITTLVTGLPALACLAFGLAPYRRSIAAANRWSDPIATAGAAVRSS